MKKIISAALLTLAVGGAQAQAYVGATAGVSNLNLDCSGTVSCDNTGSGFKLYGGYNFNNTFGVEVGYLDFGKASGSVILPSYGRVDLEIKTSTVFVAAAVRGDFTPNFGGAARLGLASVKSTIDGRLGSLGSTSDSQSSTKAYFGLSLDYAFTKNLKGVVAADFTTTDNYGESASVRMLTVGAQYHF